MLITTVIDASLELNEDRLNILLYTNSHFVVIELLRRASFKWVKEHGSIYRVWFTLRPMVVIAAPELLEVRKIV
jgi:hypothetical protein